MQSIFTKKSNNKNRNINQNDNQNTGDANNPPEDKSYSNEIKNKNPNILESASGEDDMEYYQTVLSLDDIKQSIPNEASGKPKTDLLKTHTEWRWRFFNIDGRKLVEISKQEPNSERLYVDNTSKWTKYSLDKSWDKFIVDARYYYANTQ